MSKSAKCDTIIRALVRLISKRLPAVRTTFLSDYQETPSGSMLRTVCTLQACDI